MPRQFLLAALLLAACGQSSADSADAAQRRARAPPTRRPPCSPAAASGRPSATSRRCPGVIEAVSGFAGGRVANPSYEQVVRGGTGHLEAVQVTFDPARISYGQLARRFLRTIDPTDAGGQFCDRGEQLPYRHLRAQSGAAARREAAVAEANRILRGRVVTPVRGRRRFLPGRGLSPGLCAPEPRPLQPLPRAAAARTRGSARSGARRRRRTSICLWFDSALGRVSCLSR